MFFVGCLCLFILVLLQSDTNNDDDRITLDDLNIPLPLVSLSLNEMDEFGLSDPLNNAYSPVFCAWEGAFCFLHSQKWVRYGSGRHFSSAILKQSTFRCAASEFGDIDPNPGFHKHCIVFERPIPKLSLETNRLETITPGTAIGSCFSFLEEKEEEAFPTKNNKTTVTEDRIAVRALLEELHFRPCSANTRISTSGDRVKGGFGNILVYVLAAYHQAVLYNATFVFDDTIDHWPVRMNEIVKSSSCQQHWQSTDSKTFRHVSKGNIDAHVVVRHSLFTHRPLLWWFQQLADFLFVPPKPKGLMTFIQTPDRSIMWTYRRWIGVHVRHGDSCTTVNVNHQRPPCASVKTYADAIFQYQQEYPQQSLGVLLATDDESVVDELQILIQPIPVFTMPIDRSIYRPVSDLKIED